MTRLLALFAALLAFTAAPAAAQTTRALIVGIDTYRYSTTNPQTRDAGFTDLTGAVADAVNFKNLLRTRYEIDLDRVPQGKCPTEPHPLSITLYNMCATKAAVLTALDDLIARSAAGDTLVFYFSGHGSLYVDRAYDQASGYNGTILPYDARAPGTGAEGEIIDTALKAIKDRAVAKGIYWVTVFDSCNSGTATRNGALGQARSAPPVATRGAPLAAAGGVATAAVAAPAGSGGGYWVHLAAAQDGEQAMEVGGVGERTAGVFTTALVETMRATPYASFADIIREVQAKVAARGRTAQNPMAEGDGLKAMLGRAPEGGTSFEVALEGGQPVLKAGRLSGVTGGSRFALFRRRDEAFAPGAVPLLTAETGAVSEFSAELKPIGAATAALTPLMVAVETQHAFGDAQVRVANRMTGPLERKAVEAALVKTGLVTLGGDPQVQIAPRPGAPGEAVLLSGDGTEIGLLGAVSEAGFAERVGSKLKKVLRAQLLLALRTDPAKAGLSLCLDDSVYELFGACPQLERRNVRVVKAGKPAFTSVINQAEKPRWLYVFGIDPSFGIELVYPKPGASDSALPPDSPKREADDPMVLKVPGTYYFVTLATDAPIDAAALEQKGTRARAGTACDSVLEKLLCDAAEGRRDASAPKVGPWTARFDTVVVE